MRAARKSANRSGSGRTQAAEGQTTGSQTTGSQTTESQTTGSQTTDSQTSGGFLDWYRHMQLGWDRFWFASQQPHTLSLIRVLTGLMLCYNHVVWSTQLSAFLGPNAWISSNTSQAMAGDGFVWTFLWHLDSPAGLSLVHFATLIVFVAFTLGWKTRPIAVLTWFLTISYCHRLQGVLFGFDQVLAMLTMYLMIGRSGDAYSVDAWLAKRREDGGAGGLSNVSNNVASRLIQVHLCIIYLFGGLAKVRGETWWDGSAMWNAVANLEYQSLNVTFLGRAPWLLAMLALGVVFWETFYCALVWPRWSRPIALGAALLVHAGIGVALGMITFGLAMITLNLSFLAPAFVERSVTRTGIRCSSIVSRFRSAGTR